MPVSLIPQQRSTHRSLSEILKSFTGGGLFVTASLFILFVVIVSYIGLSVYQSHLNVALQKDNEEYANLQQGSAAVDQRQAADFAQRAQHIKELLGAHANIDPLFALLENYTHHQVTWTNLSFGSSKGELKLQGIANGYRSVAEQMVLWQKNSTVQHVSVSNFALGNDGVLHFYATVQLSPKAFVSSLSPSS